MAQVLDAWGVPLAASPEAAGHLDRAVGAVVRLTGEPGRHVDAASAADPSAALAHSLGAMLALYDATEAAVVAAAPSVQAATEAAGGDRERAHAAAARAWLAGDLDGAVAVLDAWLAVQPLDLLALRVSQDLHFFLGHSEALETVIARARPAWSGAPGEGYVAGMHAFGLEENGRYREAEDAGGAALAADGGDVWAVHAVAHVLEMEGRHGDAVGFLTATVEDWRGSYFAVHNWWHLGLVHLEAGRTADALAVYDDAVRAEASIFTLDLVDASSLLWRLWLVGVDVGDRPAEVAGAWLSTGRASVYAFNDAHAAMALALAGWSDALDDLDAAMDDATATNARMVAAIGRPLARAVRALTVGDAGAAVDLLLPARAGAATFGGSHAQRDLIDQTLLAAAVRAGRTALVETLVADRVARKPSAAAHAASLVAANRGR